MIKACLFDLDGTVLDTLTTIAYYGNKALENFGIKAIDVARYRYLAGNGAQKLVERMLTLRDVYSEELYRDVYEYYMACYDSNPTYLTEPFEGIEDLLADMKAAGIKTGVISNKPDFATRSVCAGKIKAGLLDCVRGQVEGVPIKPHPQGPLEVLRELKAEPKETMYVGDTSVDMETGKTLGAYTVGVTWGFRERQELLDSGADVLVDNPGEIWELINKN